MPQRSWSSRAAGLSDTLPCCPALLCTALLCTAAGPGEYDSSGTTAPRGPAFSIGTRARAPTSRDISPGPGQYDSSRARAVLDSSRAFTMGARPAAGPGQAAVEAAGQLPGPGQYDTASGAMQLTGPAYSIGARWKQQAAGDDSLGPGAYDALPAGSSGPAYSIPASKRAPPAGLSASQAEVPGEVAAWQHCTAATARLPHFHSNLAVVQLVRTCEQSLHHLRQHSRAALSACNVNSCTA